MWNEPITSGSTWPPCDGKSRKTLSAPNCCSRSHWWDTGYKIAIPRKQLNSFDQDCFCFGRSKADVLGSGVLLRRPPRAGLSHGLELQHDDSIQIPASFHRLVLASSNQILAAMFGNRVGRESFVVLVPYRI